MKKITIFLALLFTLTLARVTEAQLAGKGSISGVVTDPTGAVISNAQITVTSTTRGISLTAKSSGSGDYTVSPLDADIYTVSITAEGFQTTRQENVHVDALSVTDVPIKMMIGASSETVTISAEPPALETSNATLGATLEQHTYAALPIQMGGYGNDGARRATDFVALIPGVQFNETNGDPTKNSGVINGGGARGGVSDIYINGLPFISAAAQGDPRFIWTAISVDAIDQLQVQTTGYSAIYEGLGVQNYTIKSGGNKFHGSAYEYFRNTALDTYGFFAKANALRDANGILHKPEEHQNEYGFVVSGPVFKNKLFFFGNYDKYNDVRGPKNAYETLPTTKQQQGDFTGITVDGKPTSAQVNIYDPTSCPNGNTGNCQRTQYVSNGVANVIPKASQSPQAMFLQSFLPALSNQNQTLNYLGGYKTGFDNYTITGKADYAITSKQTATLTIGWGQQNTVGASAQGASNSTSFQQLPAPYINANQFNPQTRVVILDHTYVLSSKAVNQLKYGFASYDGSNVNLGYAPQFSATTAGIKGLPKGQAGDAFPGVQFTGVAAPNYWAGFTGTHKSINDYTLVDNFSYTLGRHSLTAGATVVWLQYNYDPNVGSSTDAILKFNFAQTSCYSPASSTTTCATGTTATSANINSNSGLPYASFLAGAANNGSFTTTTVEEVGARWRPISPYVQDDWKVSSKLMVNLGLRYDFYPTYTEARDRLSFLDPNANNPVTGNKGALAFAGNGTTPYCNCRTNISNWAKNYGPRVGMAYSVNPSTVIRASYGLLYAHGNGVAGSAISQQGTGLLGYAASPNAAVANANLPAFYLQNGFPSYTLPPFINAGYGTGYVAGGQSPQTIAYGDPRYGARAPEFSLWSFGLQQSFSSSTVLTATYVGSQGHFLDTDAHTARGLWINQLDPKYLALGSLLSAKATPANLALAGIPQGPFPSAAFDPAQTVAQALKPFPQYNAITDAYGAVGNSNYHALQLSLSQRETHGASFTVNYTWAKNIDDTGTFRSGYAIPAAYIATGQAYSAARIERSLSLADRRHNLVAFGVFESPFGKSLMANNSIVKAIAGGFKLSTIFTAYTGSPLAITAATCGTNPSQTTCMPNYNSAYSGTVRTNGKWGSGVTADNVSGSFLDSNAFTSTQNYTFGDVARTAPYGITGPGSYNVDLSLRRTFILPHAEGVRMILEGDLYNVTNHVLFGGINTTFGSGSFGQVTSQANLSRDAQLAARVEF
jgi:hypothetical protein